MQYLIIIGASFITISALFVITMHFGFRAPRNREVKNPDDFGYQYLGLEDKTYHSAMKKLDVWPNPANNRFSFSYQGKNKTAVYTILNLTGKIIASGLVQHNETVSIDMSNIPKGLYIIHVTDQNNIYSAKVIKQ